MAGVGGRVGSERRHTNGGRDRVRGPNCDRDGVHYARRPVRPDTASWAVLPRPSAASFTHPALPRAAGDDAAGADHGDRTAQHLEVLARISVEHEAVGT